RPDRSGGQDQQPGTAHDEERKPMPTEDTPYGAPKDRQNEEQWGKRAPRWETTIDPEHLRLALSVPPVLSPQGTGVVPGGIGGVDRRVDIDPSTRKPPSVVEVGVLGRAGWERPDAGDVHEVGASEGTQIHGVDLLPLRSVMEARRTHRQRAVHGGGHGAAEGVVPHRVHPAPDCAVELHNALHRAADIVGGVPGVTVGTHEY